MILPWLLMPLIAAPLVAQESDAKDGVKPTASQGRARVVPKPLPWVGLTVGKLNEVMRHHATGVPEGVGFLVESIDADGPAEAAGVRKYDVLWKFGDQFLINEAQFATLLRMRESGDKVGISVVRSGRQLDLDLVLGDPPEGRTVARISPSDLPLMPTGMPNMPTVVTRPQDRTAELTRADGSQAKLRYEGEEAHVVITDAAGENLYDGPVRKDGCFAVPDEWKSPVGAMLRSLYKAKNPDWVPRRPRPRTVIPPGSAER